MILRNEVFPMSISDASANAVYLSRVDFKRPLLACDSRDVENLSLFQIRIFWKYHKYEITDNFLDSKLCNIDFNGREYVLD